ncbi:hypothetical protein ACJJTC_004320 [Scirpophaga incertulas]
MSISRHAMMQVELQRGGTQPGAEPQRVRRGQPWRGAAARGRGRGRVAARRRGGREEAPRLQPALAAEGTLRLLSRRECAGGSPGEAPLPVAVAVAVSAARRRGGREEAPRLQPALAAEGTLRLLSRRECAGGSPGEAPLPVAVAVAVSLPDGVVAVRRPHDSSLLWRQKPALAAEGTLRLLSRRECAGGSPGEAPLPVAVAVAVSLPDGVVAVRRPHDSSLLWRQKPALAAEGTLRLLSRRECAGGQPWRGAAARGRGRGRVAARRRGGREEAPRLQPALAAEGTLRLLSRRECAGGSPGEAPLPVAVAVAVSLPDGVVAVRRPHDSSLLWRQKPALAAEGTLRLLSRRECAGGSPGEAPLPVAVAVSLPDGVVAVRRPHDSSLLWRQKPALAAEGTLRLLSRRECAGGSPGEAPLPVAVAVSLPDGVVAVRRPHDSSLLWRQKPALAAEGTLRLLSRRECAGGSPGEAPLPVAVAVSLPDGVVAVRRPPRLQPALAAEGTLRLLSRRECAGGSPGEAPLPVAVAVSLPDGVVAVRRPHDASLLWRQKLEAPVAGMWRLQGGSIQNIDVLLEATQSLVESNAPLSPPSLYIGVHNTQIYIQESILYTKKLDTAVSAKPVPWKVRHSTPLLDDGRGSALSLQDPDPNTLSLITLYGSTEPGGNHGFFLYLQETCDQSIQVNEEAIDGPEIVPPNSSEEHEHHIHVHAYSLWFWWKEVLLIAISSALLMNLMIWPRFFAPKIRPSTPIPVNQENIIVERYYERPVPPTTTEYSGRYENDFTPLRCLGRGGFGVVFEARNNIDHCSYAVKRITLPRRESKRERVLREVRALAKLEHEHIVRYFNAWLEEPPPLWQQKRDEIWMRELDGVSLTMTDDYTATSPAIKSHTPTRKGDSVKVDLQKFDPCLDALDFEKQLAFENSKRQRSLSCNDSFSIVFDENASKHTSMSIRDTDSHSVHLSSGDSRNVSSITNRTVSKQKEEDDDSFIVFAHSKDQSGQLSEAREPSIDKRLERIKEMDSYTKTDSSNHSKKKKKGHRRHWSLDMCVRDAAAPAAPDTKMYLYIQMQLCRRDSLHDWLRQNCTSEARGDQVKVLFSQIVAAVEYVHLAGLIHRDLKPSNIFFAPDGRVKVGDFGLVTAMADGSQDGDTPTEEIDTNARHTYRVGTHLYMSPEQLMGRSYSYKVDIYSLGLVLLELLQPFGTESERVACLMQARNHNYPERFHQHYPQETKVLKMMLSEDPSQRPTAMGVKARAPLYQKTDEKWHFALPSERPTQLGHQSE